MFIQLFIAFAISQLLHIIHKPFKNSEARLDSMLTYIKEPKPVFKHL